MTVKTAEFVRDISNDDDSWTGTAKLWRVSPPVRFSTLEGGTRETEYVITSATVAIFSGPETYIFPADSEGEVMNWIELPGSYRGDLDHDRAIRNLVGSRWR